MNKQEPGIEWTHVWGRPGWTWNPVAGCLHKCRWNMPDGAQAVCYAETTAERMAQAAYPDGFSSHYWHENRLKEPVRIKPPSGIFIDSMSDLLGHWVPAEQVQAVLDTCAATPQHIYFLLTKNAPRLLRFELPDNVWAGVSMPPDWFMGNRIKQHQRRQMLATSLDVLAKVRAKVRWMSFEPLSWDVAEVIGYDPLPLEWAVIGAASNGKTYYQPEPEHLRRLVDRLDRWRVPIFFKGNLRGSQAAHLWREAYPPEMAA